MLLNSHIAILASQGRDTADSFTEEAIGDGENVGLVDDVQLLDEWQGFSVLRQFGAGGAHLGRASLSKLESHLTNPP